MGKLSTPDWIREGYDSKEEYEKNTKNFSKKNFGVTKSGTQDFVGKGIKNKKKEKGKTFKIRKCPKCGSYDVVVIITGEEGKGKGEWECKKCKWKGRDIKEEEVSEDEFMKYLDEKGEEVA